MIACDAPPAGVDLEVLGVRRKTVLATSVVLGAALAATLAAASAGGAAALLPSAFVLGWLNLAGL